MQHQKLLSRLVLDASTFPSFTLGASSLPSGKKKCLIVLPLETATKDEHTRPNDTTNFPRHRKIVDRRSLGQSDVQANPKLPPRPQSPKTIPGRYYIYPSNPVEIESIRACLYIQNEAQKPEASSTGQVQPITTSQWLLHGRPPLSKGLPMLDVQAGSGEARSSEACGQNLLATEHLHAVVDLPAPITWSGSGV